MWWSSASALLAALTCACASFVTCMPSGPGSSTPRLARQSAQNGHHITSGVGTRDSGNHLLVKINVYTAYQVPAGHPHIRREIRDLHANYPDQWALYLLGLLSFQQVDQSDPLSYYRISGIHARPYELWQDAHGTPSEHVGAYCPHNSRLFLTWHRPYLALFEQELWKHVRSIADQAPHEFDRWSTAADAFRMPFWDTALGIGDGGIPEFLVTQQWTVWGPHGSQTIDNPLFWYRFHPLVPQDLGPSTMANYNKTMRWPTTQSANAEPQVNLFRTRFLENQRPRQDAVHNSFAWNKSFRDFTKNLEIAHAYIHIDTGGDGKDGAGYVGHMWDIGYSAFDPIFMLHHANFDRYMALYLAANPNTWIQPEYVDGSDNVGNFWIPRGATVDASWGLPPFWKNGTTFYSSEDVRHTDILGYAYPETQHWTFPSEEKWRNHVRGTIQKLYSNSARATLMNSSAGTGSLDHIIEQGNTFINWAIEAKASIGMPASFNARFSLVGDLSSDHSTKIGMWARMMTADDEDGNWETRQVTWKAKREHSVDRNLTSIQSLTSSLLDRIVSGQLRSLEPDVVIPYLKDHLMWEVYMGTDRKRMISEQLKSFSVKVTATKMRIPDDPFQPLDRVGNIVSYLLGPDL